jgi:hypothetical protein
VSTLNSRVTKLERRPQAGKCCECGLRHQRELASVEDLVRAVNANEVCVRNANCRTCRECKDQISLLVIHREEFVRQLPEEYRRQLADGAA